MTSPEEPQAPPEESAFVEVVAGLLVVGASVAATQAAVAAAMAPLALTGKAVGGAVVLAAREALRGFPRPFGDGVVPRMPTRAPTTAGEVTRRRERYYRAAYVVNAAKRVHRGMRSGQSVQVALRAELVNWKRHLEAVQNRRERATQVDAAAARFGALLGWGAVMDARTSADCRQANGKNFNAGTKPAIGYPGTVHPHCRCVPRAPWEGGAMLPTKRRRRGGT